MEENVAKRNELIFELRNFGCSFAEIGRYLGLSRERCRDAYYEYIHRFYRYRMRLS